MQNERAQQHTALNYQVNPAAEKSATLDVDLQPINLNKAVDGQLEVKGKVIKEYSSNWLYFAIIVDNLASGLAGAAFIAYTERHMVEVAVQGQKEPIAIR
jgi:MFS transporter, PAT family, beta-lactamase induction signal transducer AmpG